MTERTREELADICEEAVSDMQNAHAPYLTRIRNGLLEAAARLRAPEGEWIAQDLDKVYLVFPKLKHVARDLYEIEEPHPRIEWESGEFFIAVTEGVKLGHLVRLAHAALRDPEEPK